MTLILCPRYRARYTANCQPCLQMHVEQAIKSGAELRNVTLAIEIGKHVRKGATAKMEAFSTKLQAGTAQKFEVVTEGNGFQYLGP